MRKKKAYWIFEEVKNGGGVEEWNEYCMREEESEELEESEESEGKEGGRRRGWRMEDGGWCDDIIVVT